LALNPRELLQLFHSQLFDLRKQHHHRCQSLRQRQRVERRQVRQGEATGGFGQLLLDVRPRVTTRSIPAREPRVSAMWTIRATGTFLVARAVQPGRDRERPESLQGFAGGIGQIDRVRARLAPEIQAVRAAARRVFVDHTGRSAVS
jgi:hypothetical protein